jgi:peptide-methionine (S)-S-oxide reductase
METALFAAGCFWGIEDTFRHTPGVVETAVGYSGGHVPNPTYKLVCTDTTGHAEVVRVTFDPTRITYQELLRIFCQCHDPTQLNRQGPDFGSQYRSAIFYFSPEQEQLARESMRQESESGRHARPIVTEISSAQTFYPAEEYHQQYYEKNHIQSCPR